MMTQATATIMYLKIMLLVKFFIKAPWILQRGNNLNQVYSNTLEEKINSYLKGNKKVNKRQK